LSVDFVHSQPGCIESKSKLVVSGR
jgi:hypothetical protein